MHSMSLCFNLCVCLRLPPLFPSLSLCPSLCMSLSLSACLYPFQYVCLSVYHICVSVHQHGLPNFNCQFLASHIQTMMLNPSLQTQETISNCITDFLCFDLMVSSSCDYIGVLLIILFLFPGAQFKDHILFNTFAIEIKHSS